MTPVATKRERRDPGTAATQCYAPTLDRRRAIFAHPSRRTRSRPHPTSAKKRQFPPFPNAEPQSSFDCCDCGPCCWWRMSIVAAHLQHRWGPAAARTGMTMKVPSKCTPPTVGRDANKDNGTSMEDQRALEGCCCCCYYCWLYLQ